MNYKTNTIENKLNDKGQAKMTWWFSILWHLFCPLFYVVFGTKYHGKKNAENCEGGLVTICNHVSYRDVIIMVLGLNRKMCLIGKQELFSNPILAKILKAIGAIPVSRDGSDINVVRSAIKAVKNGEVLILFPEGTRSKTKVLLPFEEGAAYIALACKTKVVPCHVSEKRVRGRRLFDFGEPIDLVALTQDFGKKDRVKKANEILRNAVIKVGEEQAARYAK